ncbi:hypothetical protein E0H61_06345 [Rhizobium leguminosarum bv. viciae]|nr:hypothetical protein [Rhizobium leguminosarum bv. viciae]TBZ79189.1 hypothetical protein E0H43_01750 [Rhizobium leguminosarum bv. viciae]TBZ85627.1 hypothetical protein E0H61_06345 [Rhizobium leguminosarum bv. viciae]
MSRTGASRVNPAGYVPTRFCELAKIAASGRLGHIGEEADFPKLADKIFAERIFLIRRLKWTRMPLVYKFCRQ